MTGDSICDEEVISDDKKREAVLLFSRRKAASAAQVGLELRLNPSKSILLTQFLVNKGLISGNRGNYSTVRLDEFYSLTTEGVREARSIKRKLESI